MFIKLKNIEIWVYGLDSIMIYVSSFNIRFFEGGGFFFILRVSDYRLNDLF